MCQKSPSTSLQCLVFLSRGTSPGYPEMSDHSRRKESEPQEGTENHLGQESVIPDQYQVHNVK